MSTRIMQLPLTCIPALNLLFTDKLNVPLVTDFLSLNTPIKNKGFGTFIIAVLYLCSLSHYHIQNLQIAGQAD